MIFISGKISGAYRAQNIIKMLGDNRKKYIHLPFYFSPEIKGWYIKVVICLLTAILMLPIRFLSILFSKKVLVLPFNMNIISILDMFIARLLGKSVIYEFYVSNYDSYVNDRKVYSSGSFKAHFALFIDKAVSFLSTYIICLNESESEYYSEFMASGSEEKIRIIPLVVDPIEISGDREGEVVLCWWGSYVPLHGLEKVIHALYLIKDLDIKLYIFGRDENKAKLYKDLSNQLGLSNNLIFNHSSNFKNLELPYFLLQHKTICLGSFGESSKAKSVLINKIVDSAALKLPMITMETSATSEFFEDKINIIYSKNNPEDIANKISEICNDYNRYSMVGDAAYEVYLSNFSPSSFSKKYMKIIDE